MAAKGGKYAEVLRRLSKIPVETGDATRDQALAAQRATYIQETGKKPSELTKLYVKLRAEKDKLSDQLSDVELKLEALIRLTTDVFEELDIRSLGLDGGGNVRCQPEPYASVVDRDAFHKWCIDNGLLGSMTLPWQTTNAMTKERLLNGEPEPPGIKAWNKPKLVLTK